MTIQLAMANEGKAVSRQVAREIWKADSTLRSKLNLEYSPHPPGGGAGGGGGGGGGVGACWKAIMPSWWACQAGHPGHRCQSFQNAFFNRMDLLIALLAFV